MSVLHITRGKDIELYADGEQLFGVTDFSAVSDGSYHEIHEYLTSVPYDTVSNESGYHITLSVLSLFRYEVLTNGAFTLTVVDGGICYDYEGCRLIKRARDVKADRAVSDVYTIRAMSLHVGRKRDE